MQEKNEIKEENFDAKLILKKKEKQIELLQKYFEHDNDITLNLINLKKEKHNFGQTFLENPNLDKIKNTPIFYLSEILKEINQKELESLDSFSTLFEQKNELNKLIELFLNPIKRRAYIQDNVKTLNKIYERIESNIIDDYIKVHYKEKEGKIVRNDKTSLEVKIKEAKNMEKEILLMSQNGLLKKIIKKMSELPGLIGEKDDEDKKILNEIKPILEQIEQQSESGEICKKWNFNEQPINHIWEEYNFGIITNKKIRLNDNIDKIQENINRDPTNSVTLKEEDVNHIIDQIMDKIHDLVLYEKVQDFPKMRKLIKQLLNINYSEEKPAEKLTKEDSENLIKLLDEIENIRTFLLLLNKYRDNYKKIPEKYEYEIMARAFNKIADFAMKYKIEKFESYLIILSDSYYYSENGKHIYIIESIKNHELFKDLTLWEKEMKSKIDSNLKLNKLTMNELEEKEEILVGFFGGNLSGSVSLMKKAGIPEKDIKKTIKKFINKYSEKAQDLIMEMAFIEIN